jgi:glycosyltransferase involved in cell wall biosynthesis
LGRIALAMLAREAQPARLSFKHAICVSAATRNTLVKAGIPVAHARVIHTGLDARPYMNGHSDPQPKPDNQALNLLCAGRLYVEKGVHTAIEAVAKLRLGRNPSSIRLSLAGSGSPDYESNLRRLVAQAGLHDDVSFLGLVPAEEMPQLIRKFDVLVVPSIWPEPFSRIVLEGMISGLVVLATPTGGTPELLVDGENGLLFAPGDAEDLAEKIARLAADPNLRRRLAVEGQRTVVERFTMTQWMNKIESYLQEVAGV